MTITTTGSRPAIAHEASSGVVKRTCSRASRLPTGSIVFAVALVARVGVILRHGGLQGSYGYDASVYFGAADALVHDRLPYRDFVLLHPPGLMLALTPFAGLTKVMSDQAAFSTAAVAFCALGAVNAVLVQRIGRRLGLGTRAAVIGGLFYATWFGAVGAEYLPRLEPLGNFLLLLTVLGVLRTQPQRRLWCTVTAGVPLGLLVSVKIWWVVPAAAVVVWHACRARSGRSTIALLAGAGIAVAVVDLPFFLASPRAMFASVVQEQLGRPVASSGSRLGRLGDLSSLPALTRPLGSVTLVVVSAVVLLTTPLLVRRAWVVRAARPAVVLLVGQLIIAMTTPSWFPFYTDYLAVAASLTVAAAAAPRVRRQGFDAGWIATSGAAVVTVLTLVFGTTATHPFPGVHRLRAAVSGVWCVMSDSPMGQIELNVLSRGLDHGCRNWIDVTGRTYGLDRAATSRPRNERWQRDLTEYLRSGGAVIIVRPGGTGLAAPTRAAVRRDGVLARSGGHVIYRVEG